MDDVQRSGPHRRPFDSFGDLLAELAAIADRGAPVTVVVGPPGRELATVTLWGRLGRQTVDRAQRGERYPEADEVVSFAIGGEGLDAPALLNLDGRQLRGAWREQRVDEAGRALSFEVYVDLGDVVVRIDGSGG